MTSAAKVRDRGRESAKPPASLVDALFAPISPASVGLFRILFGVFMAWHLSNFMPYITNTLVHSKFFLTYDGFHWLHILPRAWMVALFWVMFVACALVAVGFLHRAASVTIWLGWTYTLLLCQGHYNNHGYLFALLSFLLIFIDATRWMSVERRLGWRRATVDAIPAWQLWLLRIQIVIVYFYAGVAKLSSDWLHGYPMRLWLMGKGATPVIGGFLQTELAALFFSYCGVLFDLGIGFLLLWRRTRRWALIPLVAFHFANAVLWNIGVFPWFMLAATTLFFDPDWPERLLGRASAKAIRMPVFERSPVVVGFLGVYLAWQLLFPLRLHLYRGSPEWTGQGSYFAWRMLTVDRAEAVRVRVAIPGQGTVGFVQLDEYLNRVQFGKINMAPWQYLRFAHFIHDEMKRNAGIENAEVYVDVQRRLNERPFQEVFDPERNLAAVDYHEFANADYILPLDPTAKPGTSPEWQARLAASVSERAASADETASGDEE